MKKLKRDVYFARFGIPLAEQINVPKSLKQIHKFLASSCLIAVGAKIYQFDRDEVINKFGGGNDLE